MRCVCVCVCVRGSVNRAQRAASCRHDCCGNGLQRSPIRGDSAFQPAFRGRRFASPHVGEPSADGEWPCSAPPPPPAWCSSSHRWYRHRHRADSERRAMRRVADWLDENQHRLDDDEELVAPPGEKPVAPPSELDIIVVHEHRCRRYYTRRRQS